MLKFGFSTFAGLFAIVVSAQFGPAQEITSSMPPGSQHHLIDLDLDGDVDILTYGGAGHKISWYPNLGNNLFGDQIVIAISQNHAGWLTTGDLDNDGDIDLVGYLNSSGVVSWYENDGDANFTLHGSAVENNFIAHHLKTADINGDGYVDIFGVINSQLVSILNNGAGGFENYQVIFEADYGLDAYDLGDIDSDGDIDVQIALYWGYTLYWIANDGAGNFGNEVYIDIMEFAQSIESVDMDNDGDLDIIAASDFYNRIRYYENNGVGDFADPITIASGEYGGDVVTSSDVDSDGDLDLVCSNSDYSRIWWYKNLGNVTFDAPKIVSSFYYGNVSSAILFEDKNQLVIGYHEIRTLSVYELDEQENITEIQSFRSGLELPQNFDLSDLNQDGILDILTSSHTDSTVVWFEGAEGGSFENGVVLGNHVGRARFVMSGDMDNDGDLDVIASSFSESKVLLYENDGTGLFSEPSTIFDSDFNIKSIVVTDIDGDGWEDFALSAYSGGLGWYKNNGNQTFTEHPIATTIQYNEHIETVDIDMDGDQDLISGSNNADDCFLYINDGVGQFEETIFNTSEINIWDVCVYDADYDGDLDILAAAEYKILFFPNDGNQSFGAPESLYEGYFVHTLRTSDLDGDGDLDLICSTSFEQSFFWLERNDFTLHFGEPQVISDNAVSATDLQAGDIDGDSDLDLISLSHSSSRIDWYENYFGNQCNDPLACNYSSFANSDDGSCCYDNCGCTDIVADNYDSSFACDDGSCLYLGCLDYQACNFSPSSNFDDGSCLYPNGCLDPFASNYNSSANCEDGSCLYSIQGTVFHDLNDNGTLDEDEYGVGLMVVHIEELGLTAFTNDDGEFLFSNLTEGQYQISAETSESFLYFTTWNELNIQLGQGDAAEANFGVSDDVPVFNSFLEVLTSESTLLCDNWTAHHACYRNLGSVPLSGIIEFEFDSMYTSYAEITELDSIVGNTVYSSFEDLLPGVLRCFSIDLLAPPVDFIDSTFMFNASFYGFSQDNLVASGQDSVSIEMVCSFDPNDKIAEPIGYTPEHYVLENTEIEFRIRFQNTGTAPAQNVLVTDTIDESFDISTFQLQSNSHSLLTNINENVRVIEFLFADIQLPDSTSNEPESHGFFTYSLQLKDSLQEGLQINNSANIFFDSNEPIITNITWHTIYVCPDDLATIESETTSICVGQDIILVNTQDLVEDYSWTIDSLVVGVDSLLILNFPEQGEIPISLFVSNPLCVVSDSIPIIAIESPSAIFSQLGNALIAESAAQYQWFLNGTAVPGATEQQLNITESGDYHLQVANDQGCTNISEPLFIVYTNVQENNIVPFSLVPNPMSISTILHWNKDFQCSSCNVEIFSSQGKLVRTIKVENENQILIDRGDLAQGVYLIQLKGQNSESLEIYMLVQ